jgi:hypothetical protein
MDWVTEADGDSSEQKPYMAAVARWISRVPDKSQPCGSADGLLERKLLRYQAGSALT